MAVVDVQDLVKEAAYVETETIFFLFGKHFGILIVEDPATL